MAIDGRRGPRLRLLKDALAMSAQSIRLSRWTIGLLVAVLAVSPANADDSSTLLGRPVVQLKRAENPPVLDGKLDDPVWRDAVLISEFVQSRPVDGAPATEETEVRVAYDSGHLYFAFYARYSDPALIRANRSDRDQTRADDRIAVYFDPFLDQQRAYMLSVNGYGIQADALVTSGGGGGRGRGGSGRGREDRSWDALFESKGGLVDDGWIVEMAVPFKSLRYPAKAEGETHQWGFQILRTIPSKNEEVVWAPVSRDVQGFLTQMGVVTGMSGVSTSRNLEFLPTFTTVKLGSLDSDTGVYTEDGVDPDAGVSVKYGVTSNLTLDFTYNPDFSQIESDRPRITANQRFPIFFEERRPFFLEGRQIFNTEIDVVHTRAIVNPRHGAKLTGKIGRTTVGVLFANDEAAGLRDDLSDPAFGRSANVAIGRVRYDMYSESFLGAIVTDREFMDSYSRLAGVDGRFRLGLNHRFSFMAVTADSRDEEGVRSSGPAYRASFNRSGRRLSYGFQRESLAPGFETDLGSIRRNDVSRSSANTSYRFWPQNALISWGPRIRYVRNHDHDGVLQDEEVETGIDFNFANNIGVRGEIEKSIERYLEVDFDKTRYGIGGNISSSRFLSVFFNYNWGDAIRFMDDPFLGRSLDGFVSVTLRPSARFQTNLTTNLRRFTRLDTGDEEFDVRIYRARTTYQFSDRLLVRNITEYDSWNGTVGANLLVTYRINAGTVGFIGYDHRLQRGINFNDELFDSRDLTRTSRSFFMKLSYLFRY